MVVLNIVRANIVNRLRTALYGSPRQSAVTRLIYSETAIRGVPQIKVFFETVKSSQANNTCARVSFLIKFQV